MVRSALMDLWLVRHGEAVSERQDPSRPLTPEGARAVSEIAASLAGKTGSFDLVAASGKRRAGQTAPVCGAGGGGGGAAPVRPGDPGEAEEEMPYVNVRITRAEAPSQQTAQVIRRMTQ